ncbi:MAG: Cof-type HAD-IIB family hydrolase [Firmicutes bacterium]|nr:Cof-type HAD-IIB family hydrolase [Bacillota bacterium]
MKLKTIFTDLDETLLNSEKIISDRTLKAIKKAQAQGYGIVPCTGAPFSVQFPRCEVAGVDYIISSNGAFIYDVKSDKVVYESVLDTSLVKKFIEMAMPYCDDFLFHLSNKTHIRLSKITGPLSDFLGANKITQIEPRGSIEAMTEFSEPLQKFADENGLRIANKSLILSDKSVVWKLPYTGYDIVNGTVSKGSGLRRLCEILGIDMADTVAIGDGMNDVLMFKEVGFKVAMGNALEQLKKLADIVVAHHDDDGVAEYLESIIN